MVQIVVTDKIDGVRMLQENGDFGPVVEFHLRKYFGTIDGDNPGRKDQLSYRICTGLVGGFKVDFETHHTILRGALSCFTQLVQLHLGQQNLSKLVVNAIKELRNLEKVHIVSCKSQMVAVQDLVKDLKDRKPVNLSEFESTLHLTHFAVDHLVSKKSLFEIEFVNKHPAREVHVVMKNTIIEDAYVQLNPETTRVEKLDEFLHKINFSDINGTLNEIKHRGKH